MSATSAALAMRASAIAMGCLAMLAIAGCSTQSVCPAIGYGGVLAISLAEPRDDVMLDLCVDVDCDPGDDPHGRVGIVDGDGLAGWEVGVTMPGDIVGYRLRDGDGALLAAGSEVVDWTVVGPVDACGGGSFVGSMEIADR